MSKFIHTALPASPQDSRSLFRACSPEEASIDMALTIVEVNGRYKWWYSDPLIIVRSPSVTVNLRLNFMSLDGTRARILCHACTGVTRKHSPIRHFHRHDDCSASFELSLRKHQMVDFGIFVEVQGWGCNLPSTLFCDPQASNDPIKT